MKKYKKEQGITMVSLVITIIVLLILSAITLGLVLGDNGIITKANTAKEETMKAQAKEEIQEKILEYKTIHNGEFDIDKFFLDEDNLLKDFMIDNVEHSLISNNYKIYIDENGNITDEIDSVTAIIPNGTINITENGTFDVTNYASALVDVQKSSVEHTTGSYTRDRGYSAWSINHGLSKAPKLVFMIIDNIDEITTTNEHIGLIYTEFFMSPINKSTGNSKYVSATCYGTPYGYSYTWSRVIANTTSFGCGTGSLYWSAGTYTWHAYTW